MPSRQDQLHSYQYSLQRVVAALVTHDPDPQRSPLRRAGTTALVSLLIAALAVLAATIYGIFTGNSNVSPKDASVVFQEKGTGARFVYSEADSRLHPVLNYASGLLLANAEAPEMKGISSEKLATVPLGDPLGIPDAPDSLPGKKALLTERWSVCTDNTSGAPLSTLLAGVRITDGTVLAQKGQALLVSDPGDRTYLIFGNRRFAIPAGRVDVTLNALRLGAQSPWPVSVAWINAVPAGPDLVAPRIAGVGGNSAGSDFRVGQLVTDGRQVAVILADGKAVLTEMQAALMRTVPGRQEPIAVGNDFLSIPTSQTRVSDAGDPDGLPPAVPALTDGTPAKACITLPVDKAGDGIRIDPATPQGLAVAGIPGADNSVRADRVFVERGKGAVTALAASSTAPAGSGTVSVVTDTGRQYPLANRALLTKLGYGGVRPQQIPSELISLMPMGPALDPARARQTSPQ
ncbi:type VII secretion protein EccB [Paractinoplanes atraurantiacus]|uniref:Type VII secretion protein EccB n=1 Tax=Paractinoplanes atraurantiacus TaxID=1036182 RepID=A0A285JEQ2_9ACTN|nr:type VII secretion protein EccB [Actinoplanes atraurantiacus]SNY58307.1 type VII secretion protein EccB [Actinoplanes atraurantiacus]